jgi:putative ABC transport system permease protein
VNTFFQDIGYGLRMMRRAPAFTAAAVLTLALGIGVNTATFGIVSVLSLKPLPYRNPERIAFVLGYSNERRQRLFNLPLADAMDLASEARSFEAVAAYRYWSANLSGGGQPERLQAYRVTANTFSLLGIDALRGRALTPDDGRLDAPDASCSATGCGSAASAARRRSSDSRSRSTATHTPSSASCRRASSFPSSTSRATPGRL